MKCVFTFHTFSTENNVTGVPLPLKKNEPHPIKGKKILTIQFSKRFRWNIVDHFFLVSEVAILSHGWGVVCKVLILSHGLDLTLM